MELLKEDEIDSLATLEERIHQAIELVARLRREHADAVAQKLAACAERDAARNQLAGVVAEVEALRAERRQVRSRIEKLLGQIDSLSAV